MKQASDCYYKLVTKNLTTIFWWYSEANEQSWSIHWILLDVFFYIQLSFSTFFMDSKVNCQISYDDWYVQKYLKGIFHKGMLLNWKESFTCAILSFSSPRCAIITRLNALYTKFRSAMMAQLNKIWRVWAYARAITCHSGTWGLVEWGFGVVITTTLWHYKELINFFLLGFSYLKKIMNMKLAFTNVLFRHIVLFTDFINIS